MTNIQSVTLVDGTRYKLHDPVFGGIINEFVFSNGRPEILALLGTGKRIHIPYHSILTYLTD